MSWTFENGRFRDSETGKFVSLSEVLERRHRRRDLALATFSLIVAIASVGVSVELTRRQNELAIEALTDQKVSAAWQILALEGTGSTGKRYALEVLLQPGQTISGIDLSCIGRGAKWQEDGIGSYECESPTDLRGLAIGSHQAPAPLNVQLRNTDLTGADLSGAQIYGSSWYGVYLDGATLLDTAFIGTTIGESSFRVAPWLAANPTFEGGSLANIDFTRSDMTRFVFTGAVLFAGEFNVSNTLFCDEAGSTCASGLTKDFFNRAWYYSEMPPVGLGRIAPLGAIIRECTLDRSDTENGLGFAESYRLDKFEMEPLAPTDCRWRDVLAAELPLSVQEILLD